MKRIVLFCSGIALVACGSDPTPPPAAPTGDTTQAQVEPAAQPEENPKPDDNPNQSNINISDAIRKACGITDAEAFFAYNSARVRPEDTAVFDKLAKCFMEGPLKGKAMRLVGHADPRGEPEYNMVLGGRRADNVKSAVVGAGMDQAKVDTTSRGEMDASGTDESSWAQDRRVDIVLAE